MMSKPPVLDPDMKQSRADSVNKVRGKFVNLGSQKVRWSHVRSKKGFKSDEEVARLLINSFYKVESKGPLVSSMHRLKNRKVFKQGNGRVLILQKEVWTQWQNLKCSLRINNNNELAAVLIDTWHDRAAYQKACHDTEEPLLNSTEPTNCWTSASESRGDILQDNVIKVEKTDDWPDDDSTVDLNESFNHFEGQKNCNELTEESPGGSKEEWRKHVRVQLSNCRQNYEQMDCKGQIGSSVENTEQNNKKLESYESMFDTELLDMRQRVTSQEVTQENTRKKQRQKKKRKTDEEDDPDYVVSDEDESSIGRLNKKTSSMKHVTDSLCRDYKKVDTSNRICRKNKRSGSLDNTGKRKRIKNTKNKPDVLERKSEAESKSVKVSNEMKSVKKPWISIKLEDHTEKYRVETVGSFERKNRNSQSEEEFYTCLLCGRFKSTGKEIFEEHIEQHVNMVLECDLCSFVGCSEVELLKHKMSSDHMPKRQKHVCYICGIVLYTMESRQTHMGKVHNDPQFKCKFCDEKFITKIKKLQHIRAFHKGRICNGCKTDCEAMSVEEFKEHVEHCKPGHQCQLCGAVLASKPVLNRHIKSTHMGVRKYQCHLCPYAAQRAMRLRDHMLTHSNVHPYSCDQCSFTCVQSCQLKSHMRTHSGEKPFKCTKCKFAAAWNVQLKQHMTVHDLEGTVMCQQCDIVFKNEKALRMHEKKDH